MQDAHPHLGTSTQYNKQMENDWMDVKVWKCDKQRPW